MTQAAQVLIVGAGPVGMTAAAELTRHGIRCRIIDQAPVRSDKSRALVLWSRTLELLENTGAVGPCLQQGMPVHGASIFAEGRRVIHFTFDELESPYPYGLMIPQCDTEAILEKHLERQGVRVELGTRLTRLTASADGVRAELELPDGSSEVVECPWLLGCDGAHSTTRHQLNLPFAGEAEPSNWLLADIELEGALPRDEVSVFWHEEGPLVFFPFDQTRARIVCDSGAATGTDKPPDPTLEDMQAIVDRRGPGGLRLKDPVWLAGFRIHERKVAGYRHGRVLLAGDAAHIHSPASGQGMNTGMQDAFNLGWKLALVLQGADADLLLGSYDQERSRVGEQVLSRTGLLTRAATLRHPVAQKLRNALAPMLASMEIVQQRVRKIMTELDIEYRSSPLSQEHHAADASGWLVGGGVRAGDRLPDAPLLHRDGSPVRLYEAIRGTGFQLLLLTGPGPGRLAPLEEVAREMAVRCPLLVQAHLVYCGAQAPSEWNGSVLLDPEQELHHRLGASRECFYLVRPDGYVGLRCKPVDPLVLRKYIDRLGLPQLAAH